MVELDDWVLLFGQWERVNSIVYKATEHQGIVVENINDVKINTPEKFFNDTNHRPLKGPFKVGDEVEHKYYGKGVVESFDSHGYIICKHIMGTILAGSCILVTPVEAFEKEEEKTFEEAVAEHFRKGLESYKTSNVKKLERAKTLIETTIAPKTYMGTPEWTALTSVWAILQEVTNDPNIRLIHGKVKDYITIPLPPLKLWIVGKVWDDGEWAFQGAFSTEEKAIAACTQIDYGYGPAILDEVLPDEITEWEGWRFPLAEKEITDPTTGETMPYGQFKEMKDRIVNLKDENDGLQVRCNTLQTQYDGLRQSVLEMKEKLGSIS